MTKKTAHIITHQALRKMVLQNKTNNDFDVDVVVKNSFGKNLLTKNIESNVGFNFGCKKVIRSDNWPGFQDIVIQSSSELKTTGLNKHPKELLIMEHANT